MRDSDRHLLICFLIMIVCFMIDSVICYFLPYNLTKVGWNFVPSVGMLMFMLVVMTIHDPSSRFFFATICGLWYSICYSSGLLIYVLIYTLICFVRSYIYRNDNITVPEYLIFAAIALIVKETSVYYLMIVTKTTYLSLEVFAKYRLLPTVGINLVLGIVVFVVYTMFNFKIEADPFENEA